MSDQTLEKSTTSKTTSWGDMPEDILFFFFNYLPINEMARFSLVSKQWGKVIANHPQWQMGAKQIFGRDFSDPEQAKIFFTDRMKIGIKINDDKAGKFSGKKIPLLSSLFQKTDTEIFMKALSGGELNKIQFLLSAKQVNINQKFDKFACFSLTATVYYDVYPIHIAAIKGHLHVFKILLAHGADISKPLEVVLNSSPDPSGPTSPYAAIIRKKYTSDIFGVAKNNQIKSFIHLARSETALKQGKLQHAIRDFLSACELDLEIAQNYVKQVCSEKRGFNKVYCESELQALQDCFAKILAQEQPEMTSCLVS